MVTYGLLRRLMSPAAIAATLFTSFHAQAQLSSPAATSRISVGPNIRLVPGQHHEM